MTESTTEYEPLDVEPPTTEYEAPDIEAAKKNARWIVDMDRGGHYENLARAFLALIDDLHQAESERDALLHKQLHDLHKR